MCAHPQQLQDLRPVHMWQMCAARGSAAQVLHPADQNGKLGIIICQGFSPGLDSTCQRKCYWWLSDLSLHCSGLEADSNHSLLDLCAKQDSLWSYGHWEAATLVCLPEQHVWSSKPVVWHKLHTNNSELVSLKQLASRYPLRIIVGTEQQTWALPCTSELCSTKSRSAILQKNISFIHLLVSHSRPMYWISISISVVPFWKLLNHSAANKNLAFQSINCCYFWCYWSLLDSVVEECWY